MIAKSEANFVFLSARKGAEEAAAALSKRHGAKIEILWRTPQAEDAQKQVEAVASVVRERVASDPDRVLRREAPDARDRRRRRGGHPRDDVRQRRPRVQAFLVLRPRRQRHRRRSSRRSWRRCWAARAISRCWRATPTLRTCARAARE
jgi:hypothetical protein